jgi:hypothetical protein
MHFVSSLNTMHSVYEDDQHYGNMWHKVTRLTQFIVVDGSTSVSYNTKEHNGINFTKISRYSGHPRNLLRFSASVKDFFRLSKTSIPALRPQPAPSSVTTGVSVTGDKAPGT